MKKGCFIKLIVGITIVTAVILYLIQNEFNEFVFNPGKKIFGPLLIEEINKEIEFVKNTPEKDSLKKMIGYYIDNAKGIEDISDNKINNIIDSIKFIVKDSLINQNELNKISNILYNNIKINERSE